MNISQQLFCDKITFVNSQNKMTSAVPQSIIGSICGQYHSFAHLKGTMSQSLLKNIAYLSRSLILTGNQGTLSEVS